jgi:hypothetical protein
MTNSHGEQRRAPAEVSLSVATVTCRRGSLVTFAGFSKKKTTDNMHADLHSRDSQNDGGYTFSPRGCVGFARWQKYLFEASAVSKISRLSSAATKIYLVNTELISCNDFLAINIKIRDSRSS